MSFDGDEELVGTDHYVSPEMLSHRSFSYASDLWALGVVLYQLTYGCVPFKGSCQEETYVLIRECQLNFPESGCDKVKDLIKKLIVREPERRLGATNINDLLQHPYFDSIDFSTIDSQLPPQKFVLS